MPVAQPILKSPDKCLPEELCRFHDFVLKAGEVKAKGLDDRIGRAAVLAFLKHGDEIVAVGV